MADPKEQAEGIVSEVGADLSGANQTGAYTFRTYLNSLGAWLYELREAGVLTEEQANQIFKQADNTLVSEARKLIPKSTGVGTVSGTALTNTEAIMTAEGTVLETPLTHTLAISLNLPYWQELRDQTDAGDYLRYDYLTRAAEAVRINK